MRRQCLWSGLLSTLLLAGCGIQVPRDKSAYVGEWQAKQMYLLITQDGSVVYKRINGGSTTSVEGPLKRFIGRDFDVGIGPFATTFVVTSLPHQSGQHWTMTVDGVELTRTEDNQRFPVLGD